MSDLIQSNYKNQKSSVRKEAYAEGVKDCKEETTLELRKLRRKTPNWKGVKESLKIVTNINI